MTAREHVEALVIRRKLQFANAKVHAEDVGRRLGMWGPEHIVARAVVADAREQLVRAYDQALALDRGEAVEVRP